jgi:hypothetical protein
MFPTVRDSFPEIASRGTRKISNSWRISSLHSTLTYCRIYYDFSLNETKFSIVFNGLNAFLRGRDPNAKARMRLNAHKIDGDSLAISKEEKK